MLSRDSREFIESLNVSRDIFHELPAFIHKALGCAAVFMYRKLPIESKSIFKVSLYISSMRNT